MIMASHSRRPLGEYGAQAIRRELAVRGPAGVPSVRTIGRILERRGALDGGRRIRRPPPPPGWYLPEVAAGRAELDSFDMPVDEPVSKFTFYLASPPEGAAEGAENSACCELSFVTRAAYDEVRMTLLNWAR